MTIDKKYGVFIWNKKGRYPEEEALRIYKYRKTAEKVAEKLFREKGINAVDRTIYNINYD